MKIGKIKENKSIIIESKGTRIMFDFGRNKKQYERFYLGNLSLRKSNGIEDHLTMGLLPDVKGLYRRDYLKHVGKEPATDPYVDAVIISHAHKDHIEYIPCLRSDIPIYCSKTTKKVLEWLEEKGAGKYTKILYNYWIRDSKKSKNKKVRDTQHILEGSRVERDIHVIDDEEEVSIGEFEIQGKAVSHSVPGSMGFLIESNGTRVVHTGDLRADLEGQRKTRDFIDRTSEFQPDIMIVESTSAGYETHEVDSFEKVQKNIETTDALSLIKFQDKDLDILTKLLKIIDEQDRKLAITPQQFFLIEKLEEAGLIDNRILSTSNKNLKCLINQRSWGMILNKVRDTTCEWKYSSGIDWGDGDLFEAVSYDYRDLQKEFFEKYKPIGPEEINKRQENYLVYSNYYEIKNLIDFKPKGGSKYLDLNGGLNTSNDNILYNWLDKFGVKKARIFIPTHLLHTEIENMVRSIKPRKVFPIHTKNADELDFGNCQKVNMETGKSYKL